MNFKLANRDKVGWIMIGNTAFTYDEPGPKDVDITKLTSVERNQFLYNCRRGVLACSDPEGLVNACQDVWASSQRFTTPNERPIINEQPVETPKEMKLSEMISKKEQELKKLLKGSVSSIKKTIVTLRTAQIRKLLEFEQEGKNRKAVKNLCNELLMKHADEVSKRVTGEDINGTINAIGVGQIGGPNVSDIVESDIEYIVLNPLGDETKDVGST